ncbi:zinc finger protein OZF-like isoform X2 [Nerophis ophidion]|uniref:zinc finger protein OZF-like isoform X2 n=1 Tax=Nerophis ophidion TaxID=159077 RepID=UPI002ADF741A|nr:zinc finger protein OZF-like isoform X2 [Nerophis ophidion]
MLKELVKERLMVAADEIFALFERTIASYEEELSRTREEARQQLGAENVQQLITCQEEHPTQSQGISFTREQEDLSPSDVKKEEKEFWITQEGKCLRGPEEADPTKLQLIGASAKIEDQPPEFSKLPSSSSSQHLTTQPDGDHFVGSQADKLLAPLSDIDNTMSHRPEDEDCDDTQKPLSIDVVRTEPDNKHSQLSKKKLSKNPFTCSVCAKSYTHECHFTQHMQTHNEPFKCSICDKVFTKRKTMLQHARAHTEEKPFSCSICGKRFSWKSSITTHTKLHLPEKPFRCSFCGKRFSQKAHMESHGRTHTGEKPFKCQFCDKRFSHQSSMAYHVRLHTREKPFSCSVCDKRFTQESQMASHMKTHTGEKPFACLICGKSYSQRKAYIAHLGKHTTE